LLLLLLEIKSGTIYEGEEGLSLDRIWDDDLEEGGS
jgi:hypothetical protein